jgi:cell division protease FtsH
MTDLGALGVAHLLDRATGDVARQRERNRQVRLKILAGVLVTILGYIVGRFLTGNPVEIGLPDYRFTTTQRDLLPVLAITVAILVSMVLPLMAQGRSPHLVVQPSQIDVGLDDVVGIGPVKDEVVRSLNLFLGYRTFQDQMGGTPRRGILFEGPPGTGKTYLAKAMARDAGVPFFFATSTGFQSSFYGMTPRRIRSFFKAMRKTARREGGVIGFIDEIDAIAGVRHGISRMATNGATAVERFMPNSDAGIVNELLVQMQSFDEPTRAQRILNRVVLLANRMLPAHRQLRSPGTERPNVLLIAATNRAADLDPALLRPGRLDRSIHFDLPSKSGRREIIDFYLARKSHDADMGRTERREQLALVTMGYTPVMIEHLFDEALMWALREGRMAMSWADLQQAKFTEEIGLRQPVEYTDNERNVIATHEAGHAAVAYLVGTTRKLEVLSIIKRAEALGLLAHSDLEERFTKTRGELVASMQISFGGMVAEELFFGEVTTGPSGDLAGATRVASYMVGALGMAGSLISFEASNGGAFSGDLVSKVLGDDRSRKAVEGLLDDAKLTVTGLLSDHRHLVAALRDALLRCDELIGDEILDVIRAAERAHAASAN